MTALSAASAEAVPEGRPERRKTRIAYLVSHPIQYQAPLLRLLARQPDIELSVFFQSNASAETFYDPGFRRSLQWDVPLVEGYRHEFLPALARRGSFDPWSHGMLRRLRRGRFDVLWVHGWARWFNWTTILAARALGIPVLLRDEPNAMSSARSPAKVWLKRVLFFPMLRACCDGFLAIGSLNREYYLANGIDPARVFTMPYAVDNDYFAALARAAAPRREEFRAELGLEAGRPVILYAAKFLRRKRPGDLLRACKLVLRSGAVSPKPYLLFVGDGEERAALEREARDLGEDVRFLGFRNQSQLPAFFDLADVFVLPSERETWGLVVNEAMSTGRAVIASDGVGSARDLVRNGVNGFVFPLGDVAALAAALSRVLADPETAKTMGQAGAARIAEWSFAQDLEALRTALDYVLAGRKP